MTRHAGRAGSEADREERRKRFVAYRELLGLSQGAIGKASGLSPATVCRIESGEHRLAYVDTLRRAAAAYRLSVEHFEHLCAGQFTAAEAAEKALAAA